MNFFDCLSPIDVQTFLDEYWERRPLSISRKERSYYGNIFSLADVDAYLQIARSDPQPATVLIANQKDQPSKEKILGPSGSIETPLVMKAYAQGDTIVLNFMQRFWRPLTELSRNWELFFRHPVAVHAYLTPPDSQAYEPHFDAYDVFVLQLHGSKKWKIYAAQIDSPLPSQASIVAAPKTGPLLLEATLQAGDFLYLPRGMVHEVLTSKEASLHLSVSIRPYRVMDWITAAVEATATNNPLLRQPLPAGFLINNQGTELQKEIQDVLSRIDWQAGLRKLEQTFLREQEILPHSRFASLSEINSIALESRLRKYPGVLCSVEQNQDSVVLFFTGNFLRGPAHLYPALEFIAKNSEFIVRDLPGDLSPKAKLVLVIRLVKEGLLYPD